MVSWEPVDEIDFEDECDKVDTIDDYNLEESIKVQMKCFFLFPNLKEQQKSGRLPFTVS